jgi:hypothetical protein
MKKSIITTLITSIIVGNSIAQIPTNGLVSYYPFSGNANDQSGNNNNGTVTGATLTTDRFGNANCAYHFNGLSDKITLQNVPVTGTGDWTIAFWFKTSVQSEQYVCALGDDNNNTDDIQIFINTSKNLQFDLALVSGPISIDTLTDGSWHFGTVVMKEGKGFIYNNGIANDSIPGMNPNITNAGSKFIGHGRLQIFDNAAFNGEIDDIAVYNRALSQSEIQTIYTSCDGKSTIIKAYGPTTFCAGSNVMLVAPTNYSSYQWKKNGNNISGATGHTYTASATATYKCSLTCGATTVLSNGIALTSLSNTSNSITSTGFAAFCAGDSLMLSSTNNTAGYSYQWYRSNISINGATSKNYTAKNPGSYKVVSINQANGCSRISNNSISATVNCRMANPGLISGPIDEERKGLNIFPNPNAGSFTVEYIKEDADDGTVIIEILNTLGRVVFISNSEFAGGHFNQQINLPDDFSKGIYMVNLILNGDRISSKALLQ